jgi:4,4'-diaponeurosporenoate glycosyltransferase
VGRNTVNAWSIVVLLSGIVASTVIVFRVPRLARAGQSCSDVLVVIPARNEAGVIDMLLSDLAQQTSPPARVVVVDDHSTDATREVVGAAARQWPGLRLELRTSSATPQEWNPKSWAMDQAVPGPETRLLFLDADVRLAPDALGSLGGAALTGGLMSIAPRHDVGSLVETLSLPFNLIAIMGATRASRARGDANAAFGPCLLVSRATYEAVGGHAAVHQDLLDDVALAQRVRSAGFDVQLRLGADLVRYRMYPGGLRSLVDGWSKNLASGATRVEPAIGVASALWVTATLLPLWLLVTGNGSDDRIAALVPWFVVSAHTALLARRTGRFGVVPVLLAPLGTVFFVLVTVRSALLLATRRPVRWKDRRLDRERGLVDG